jgi:hypothetical protein
MDSDTKRNSRIRINDPWLQMRDLPALETPSLTLPMIPWLIVDLV